VYQSLIAHLGHNQCHWRIPLLVPLPPFIGLPFSSAFPAASMRRRQRTEYLIVLPKAEV
jgi:hypothetical protein